MPKIEKLKESEEICCLISEYTDDLIMIYDNNFKIEYTNSQTHSKVLGYPPKKFYRMSFRGSIVHKDDRLQVTQALKERHAKGYHINQQRVKHKNGHYLWFETIGKAFLDENGIQKMLCISRNITKIKNTEKKFQDAYNRAKFYRDLVVHDINNILHNISLSTELAMRGVNDDNIPTSIEDLLNTITYQLERGNNLIENITKISKMEENQPNLVRIDVLSILNNVIDSIVNMSKYSEVSIKIETDLKNIHVLANEFLIDVFENIIINGIKHNDNEKVRIEIKVLKILKANTDYIRFEFRDNGRGIPDAAKKNIFKRNYNIKGKKSGMGIGLSLVKKIIETCKGNIYIEDCVKGDYSKGSNFIVEFIASNS
ncbi:MAG: ATP-binding protein [Promethearchaeota archaeon]